MSNRLPETDVANWAFQDDSSKVKALMRFVSPKNIKGSYEPFRKVFPDAVKSGSLMFPEMQNEPTPWPELEQKLRRACKSRLEWLAMNISISRATFDHAQRNGISAFPAEVTQRRLGSGIFTILVCR